jgi:hypothetical protein
MRFLGRKRQKKNIGPSKGNEFNGFALAVSRVSKGSRDGREGASREDGNAFFCAEDNEDNMDRINRG